MSLHVARCPRCKTVFPVYEEHCPRCGGLGPRGRRNVIFTALACAFFFVTVAAITLTLLRLRDREKTSTPRPTGSPLEPGPTPPGLTAKPVR